MNKNVQDKLKERINSLLESSDIPWFKPWSSVNGIGVNYVSQKKYRGINRIFLGESEYATFLQVKNCGGKINKNAKGHTVVCPIIKTRYYDENNEETASKDDPKTVKESTVMLGIRLAYVFDIADTNLPSKIQVKTYEDNISVDESKCIDKVFELASKMGVKITEKVSDRAFYSPSEDSITVPLRSQFKNASAFLGTLLHEIGHSTGHTSRLNRDQKGYFGSESYSKEELVAEVFSLSALAEFGMNSPYDEEQTAAYLKSWKNYCSNNVNEMVQAFSNADKALEYFFA